MKKILLVLIFVFSLFFGNLASAAETPETPVSEDSTFIAITVTENIPGASCSLAEGSTHENPRYTCYVEKGFAGVTSTMGAIIKWFTYLTGLGAVLFIIINSILYMGAGLDDSLKTDAKKRIVATLGGIILLLLTGVILNIIAPWIYK